MKRIILIVMVIIPSILFAQDHKILASDTTAVQKRKDGTYVLKNNLADGLWEVTANEVYMRGQFLINANYKNGKREGKYRENFNYTTEKKSAETNYTKGIAEGLFTAWYGRIGEQMSDSGYYKNGKLEGVYTTWGKSDKSKKQVNYINGLIQGVAIEYDKLGKKSKEWNYKNDKLEGKYTAWDAAGNIIESGVYKNDKKEGVFISYYSDGKTKLTNNYKDGKIEGECISYYDTGEKWNVSNYKNDKVDGTSVLYYKNGQMKRRTFESQNAYGSNASWYENGQLESVMIVDYQNLKTDIYLWSSKGVLTKEEHHKVVIRVQGDVPIKKWETMSLYTYNVTLEETNEMKVPKTIVSEKLEKQLIPRPEGYFQIFTQQRLDGIRRTWSENGNLIGFQTFENAKQVGKATTWYSDGKKHTEGNYEINPSDNQSRKQGKWTTWSSEGNLMKEETYENGKLIEEKSY